MIKAMETSINRRMHNKGLFITSDNPSLYGEEEKKEYERIRDIWEHAENKSSGARCKDNHPLLSPLEKGISHPFFS